MIAAIMHHDGSFVSGVRMTLGDLASDGEADLTVNASVNAPERTSNHVECMNSTDNLCPAKVTLTNQADCRRHQQSRGHAQGFYKNIAHESDESMPFITA